jgi:hypothetical protein
MVIPIGLTTAGSIGQNSAYTTRKGAGRSKLRPAPLAQGSRVIK